ncbi:MAG TPA: hypothetical protein VN944_00120 [Nitrospiria bacterium]|nr:hypothetical protein [Nitrospiria bacterium]
MPIEIKYISKTIIRQLFNNSDYPSKIGGGNLISLEICDREISKPRAIEIGEPFGTRFQLIRYFEAGNWVVEVAQYLRPNGTIGASGMQDPKRLRIGDIIYIIER